MQGMQTALSAAEVAHREAVHKEEVNLLKAEVMRLREALGAKELAASQVLLPPPPPVDKCPESAWL